MALKVLKTSILTGADFKKRHVRIGKPPKSVPLTKSFAQGSKAIAISVHGKKARKPSATREGIPLYMKSQGTFLLKAGVISNVQKSRPSIDTK